MSACDVSGNLGDNHPSRAKHLLIILAAVLIVFVRRGNVLVLSRFGRSRTCCGGRGGIQGAIMAVLTILSPEGSCIDPQISLGL